MSPTAHDQSPAADMAPNCAASLPGACRRRARVTLVRWGFVAITDTVALLVSELTTNAIRHGGGCEEFRLLRTVDGVRIEVRQVRRASPRVSHARAADERGRGMFLVETLADAWGLSEDGTTVWCSLTLPSTRRSE